jgi:hypothetical protein
MNTSIHSNSDDISIDLFAVWAEKTQKSFLAQIVVLSFLMPFVVAWNTL